MEKFTVPAKLRIALYVLTGILTPPIAVLTLPDVHVLPSWAMTIWSGEVTFVASMAGFNVVKSLRGDDEVVDTVTEKQ